MKRARRIAALAMLSVMAASALAGCGDKGGDGPSKEELQAVCTTVTEVQNGMENLNYDTFSFRYEKDTNIVLERVELDYDVEGYYHGRLHVDEKVVESGKEPKTSTTEVHMWVDGSTMTQAYYYWEEGYRNNVPEKKYWVEQFASHEAALEEFEQYLRRDFISIFNPFDENPAVYTDNVCWGLIDGVREDLEYYLSSGDERMSYNVHANEGDDCKLEGTFGDSNFVMEIKDGYLVSYQSNEDQIGKFSCTLALDWTFAAPDLSGYDNYS